MATHSSVLVWRTPRDGGAWWAAVYGVGTRLKRLSSGSRWKAGVSGRGCVSGVSLGVVRNSVTLNLPGHNRSEQKVPEH